ncbi:unnamed protein product [Lampetra fluviatilis]
MALFRSFASAQLRQRKKQQQEDRDDDDDQEIVDALTCPICLEVYTKPVTIGCGHTFCGECLWPCVQLRSAHCALCRSPFDPRGARRASDTERQLAAREVPCRGCSKKVSLAKMRTHTASCPKVVEQSSTFPKFTPISSTTQPLPCDVPNRCTFTCPYCGARNLDQPGVVRHCTAEHREDGNRVVCPICVSMPWGDPNYRSSNFIQHLVHRHKFCYDTFVDYSVDEEASFQTALARSLMEK